MRDYFVTLLVFGSLPFILARPYIGVLVWSWLSYMNPHRLTWGFAYDMPFAKVVAITLFISLLFAKDVRKPPMYPLTWVWLGFVIWMCLTTATAIYPDFASVYLTRVLKIQIIIFLTLMIMHSRERIQMMLWVIYLSIGFFGIKGGVFTIANGGSFRVWGPELSFIEDNNHLAIALLMVLPIGYYLFRQESRRWIRAALVVSMGLIAISVVGSYSRGALLAIVAVSAFLWWKSSNRLVLGLAVLPLLPVLFLAMPAGWHDRMGTITEYQQDSSATGRLNAWEYAINVANDRIMGAGFDSWSAATFARWAPDPSDVHAAHSIYFSVLADHGWIGLALFLSILIGAWRLASRISRITDLLPEHRWMADLSRMLQVSLVAYGVGGAFLSMSYFDLPWHIISFLILMRAILEKQGVLLHQKTSFVQEMAKQRAGV